MSEISGSECNSPKFLVINVPYQTKTQLRDERFARRIFCPAFLPDKLHCKKKMFGIMAKNIEGQVKQVGIHWMSNNCC